MTKNFAKETLPPSRAQAYFWTKEWQEEEKEADEDIEAGRVKGFDSVEALLQELES